LARQQKEFEEKERQLAEEEELKPWNVDTIGQVGWSRSIINKEKKSDADLETQTEETVKFQDPYVALCSQYFHLGSLRRGESEAARATPGCEDYWRVGEAAAGASAPVMRFCLYLSDDARAASGNRGGVVRVGEIGQGFRLSAIPL